MTFPHGPRSRPGELVWPSFPGDREDGTSPRPEAPVPPPLTLLTESLPPILRRVDCWPLARRQIWAARTLELHSLGGRTFEECEILAAEEMEALP